MARIWQVLGGLAVILVVGGIFVATEIDFGREGTLVSRVPVAGSVLEEVMSSGPGGSGGPMFVTDADALSCDEFYETAHPRRAKAVGDTTRALREAGGNIEPDQAVALVALSCQAEKPGRDVPGAVSKLLQGSADGEDPAGAICAAYTRDVNSVAAIGAKSQEAFAALDAALAAEGPEPTYPALVHAREALLGQTRALRAASPQTHAGSELIAVLTAASDELAAAHEAWLGGATSMSQWLAGPASDGADRWFATTDRISADLSGELNNPDLLAWPPGTGCDPDPATFARSSSP